MEDASLEILPNEDGLLVTITEGEWTAYVRGYSERMVSVARAIHAAQCSWVPKELIDLAEDVLAGRRHKINLSEWLVSLPHVDIASDDERERAAKALDAIRELRNLLRDVFGTASKHLRDEAEKWASRGEVGPLQ